MGQYWKPVNLDKKEFIDPHQLGSGLKLWEIIANDGVGRALAILLAVMPERRGGGDLEENPLIGRWAGDRVVLVGDYAEDDDFPTKEGDPKFSELISDENGEMTFDKIFPEPKELQGVRSGFCRINGEDSTIWRENEAGENEPIPEEERQRWLRDYGADNLYDWHCNTYGTKWGACHSGRVFADGHMIKVSFDTAWSPPTPVIEKLVELFPTAAIIHEYFECGCAFQGGLRSNGDGEVHSWSGDYYGNRGG